MPLSTGKQTAEYHFGRCRINLGSREILRAGETVAVEPKVFDLLVYLIANRDRAVEKNELQDELAAMIAATLGGVSKSRVPGNV